jgi:hypothetical protein
VSEERYQESDSVKVSYVPPTDYAEESMDMMGQDRSRHARKIMVPPMKGMSTSPGIKEPPIASIDTTELQPGECKKTKEGIVCNEEEFATWTQSNNADDSGPPSDNTEDMKKKVGDLLEGMGLGNVFGN